MLKTAVKKKLNTLISRYRGQFIDRLKVIEI